MRELLLRGMRVWGYDGSPELLIRDDVIARIGAGLAVADGAEVLDLPGRLVLPGLVDAHCHLRVQI